jgi:hypothetical protein
MPITEIDYRKALVRICRSSETAEPGEILGAGCLITKRQVITCAHVVASALYDKFQKADELSSQAMLGQHVTLMFCCPVTTARQIRTAQVIFWRQAEQAPETAIEDVAVLSLTEDSPDFASSLAITEHHADAAFKVWGFPKKLGKGAIAEGKLLGTVDNGWVQMTDPTVTGYAIDHGFSGAPIWCSDWDQVVGLTVAKDSHNLAAKVGFMIPYLRLQPALNAAEVEGLLTQLDPHINLIQEQIPIAWELAQRGQTQPRRLPEISQVRHRLRAALQDLQQMPSENETPPPLHQFLAWLRQVASPLPDVADAALVRCLEQVRADQTAVQNYMAVQIAAQAEAARTADPHLLLWVRPVQNQVDRYEVRGLWIADAAQYAPESGQGSQDVYFQAAVSLAELPSQIQGCLAYCDSAGGPMYRCKRLPRLEIFLPMSLMDQPIDRWLVGEEEDETLGGEYELVIRAAERLEPSYSRRWPQWRAAWETHCPDQNLLPLHGCLLDGDTQTQPAMIKQLRHRNGKNSAFAGVRFSQMDGLVGSNAKLTAFSKAAGLVALWPRTLQSPEQLAPLLAVALHALPADLKERREYADLAEPGVLELGHHMSLMWENPNLVFPATADDDFPLEMSA